MAISANSVWEVRTTGTAANVNSGFFVTGASGVDYSQQNAAQYNLTGLTTAAANAIILTASASADMVGNSIHIISGTNFTAGWYEITSVVVGVSITVDRNCTTAAGAAGVGNIGGALSLGSSDDAVFESLSAGNQMWVKSGTYTLGGTVSISAAGTNVSPIKVTGYSVTRGDAPVNNAAPTFNISTVSFTTGVAWWFSNLNFIGTGTNVLVINGARCQLAYSNVINNSPAVATKQAINISASDFFAFSCSFQSYRSTAVLLASAATSASFDSCYIHDSVIGISNMNTSGSFSIIDSIFKNFTSAGYSHLSASSGLTELCGNTFVGCNITGTAITLGATTTTVKVYSSNISNFATGVSRAAPGSSEVDSCNNYFNNTVDVTNWTKGAGTIALNPGYAITDVTGTTATTSGSVITDGSKNFTTLGVVAGRDFINITAGTGITAGIYGITVVGTTTLTLDSAPGTSAVADKAYQISVGANLTPGTNLAGKGMPGIFPGGFTTGFMDIGAVQRQATTSGSGGSYGSS